MNNNCLLCNVKGVGGSFSSNSKEYSVILCQILNVPHFRYNTKKLERISYCHPCTQRILNLNDLLEKLKKMEKKVFTEKCLIGLQLEENYQNYSDTDNKFLNLSDQVRNELVTEMRLNSIKSNLVQIGRRKHVGSKVYSKAKKFRIVKNITIYKNLEDRTFDIHKSKLSLPEELTSPANQDHFYIDGQEDISTSLATSKAVLCQLEDDTNDNGINNSEFNNVELPQTLYMYDFDGIKLETYQAEPNIPTNVMDTLFYVMDTVEGIFPKSDFYIQNNEAASLNHLANSVREKNIFIHTRDTPIMKLENAEILQLDEDPLAQNAFLSDDTCENSFDYCNPLNNSDRTHKKAVLLQTHKYKYKHHITHSGAKLYKCPLCPKEFPSKFKAKAHISIHTGETPFKCTYCEKTFITITDLKIHERRHTGKKPYVCEYCEKTFCTRAEKKRHERTHTGEKPYKCMYCEKTFSLCGGCRKHEQTCTGKKILELPVLWKTS